MKKQRADLIIGTISELRALAEMYAGDDATEKFVVDFSSNIRHETIYFGFQLLAWLDLYYETQIQNKNGHALTACPETSKYWTRIVVFNENTT